MEKRRAVNEPPDHLLHHRRRRPAACGAVLLRGAHERAEGAPGAAANFTSNEEVYSDTTTGEKITYREYKVSTKLADPAMIQRAEEQIARARRNP